MFKIAGKKTVEWPVKIPVPQDGGRVRTMEARVTFEHLPQAEFDAIFEGGGTDIDLLRRVVQGWPEGQFHDENDQPMLFTPENLARLMEVSYVRLAFVASYLQIQQGREAARKN